MSLRRRLWLSFGLVVMLMVLIIGGTMLFFIARGTLAARLELQTAMQQRVSLAELPFTELQKLAPELDESVVEVLGAENAVSAFVSYGSTSPPLVAEQVQRWKNKLNL